MKESKTNISIVLIAFAFAVGVAVLDLLPGLRQMPWHGLFVVPVVWIALWSAEDDGLPVIAMAVIVSVLALLRGVLSHDSAATVSLGDRMIVVGTIWITVALALLRKRARRTFKWINLAGRRR
jgi:hypothetical protein